MNETIVARYSDQDLKEFEILISDKLKESKQEFDYIRGRISRRYDADLDYNSGNKPMEDGADTAEKENLNQLAARQQKFIHQLELALIRVKNKTYGVCIDTGKLIPKERLKLVPHTQHSIEAKIKR
ncbi:MAG: TraR/DksA family transcriptional regulator [Cytophagia bacterium]|nr:MAG: TraR/DksA family transcriptional regulator [Cytophagales bacterium]TAG07307.1 MAG: TraR/DksA family transcriptional regulator [Cytophagia bacterium]TAG44536.1 MAG: TraR/DksA family transcriptional regulator [Cytophagia bacterium]TAH30767.1 MAG: TraR/DksA family transcriptional regulator [Cytophagales bacterium]